MQEKPKTTECPYPVRVTAPEKKCGESGKRPDPVRKTLRRLMQLSEEKTGRDCPEKRRI